MVGARALVVVGVVSCGVGAALGVRTGAGGVGGQPCVGGADSPPCERVPVVVEDAVLDGVSGWGPDFGRLLRHLGVWDTALGEGAGAYRARRGGRRACYIDVMEFVYNVALSGMAFGPEKRLMCGRDSCPCGSGAPETNEHTFQHCARSKQVADMILERWKACTGENKLSSGDGRLILFGDRSNTWDDDAAVSGIGIVVPQVI